MDTLDLGPGGPGGPVFVVDRATAADLPDLVALLADDVLGAGRETHDLASYERAFAAIDADPAHLLLAVRDEAGALAATAQLTLLPCLARGGAMRLQVEAVRVAAEHRSAGLGRALFEWAHRWGERHGARLAQLTTDRGRADAHRFYASLGYVDSHLGYKRELGGAG